MRNFHTFSKIREIVCTNEKKSVSKWAMWKSDFCMTHEEIIYICCDLFSFSFFAKKNVKINASAWKDLSNDSKKQKIARLTPTSNPIFPLDAYVVSCLIWSKILKGFYCRCFSKIREFMWTTKISLVAHRFSKENKSGG